jgi:peptidyl-prolyl cis-trans isomerase SDCCAG10
MSQVYSTEPQTSGRVILETTHGPLEIQLWSRECPATTRFFLQSCLDGFYDEMVFHRIVPDFLIQTGAMRHGKPTNGSEKDMQGYREKVNADQALERRSYELNSRIRFNHRGQVAMALEVNDDNEPTVMQPQFFITLDEASYLDGKFVVFGTVSGPTVFNALRIGRTDVDEETNQPNELAEAPRIERVKIMENPIHTDIVPSEEIPWRSVPTKDDAPKNKKKKRKGVKNVNVLSFGDELEEEAPTTGGIKSSHDVVQSKILSKNVDIELKQAIGVNGGNKEPTAAKLKSGDGTTKPETKQVSPPVEDEESKPQEVEPRVRVIYNASARRKNDPPLDTAEPEQTPKPKKENSKTPKVSLVEARRAKYAKKSSKDKQKREEDTMAKLNAFQSKIIKTVAGGHGKETGEDDAIAARMSRRLQDKEADKKEEESENQAVAYHGQVLENDDDVESDWMKTRFQCRKHMDQDARLGGDGRSAMDDYEVVDEKYRDGSDKKRHKQHRQHRHRDASQK